MDETEGTNEREGRKECQYDPLSEKTLFFLPRNLIHIASSFIEWETVLRQRRIRRHKGDKTGSKEWHRHDSSS